MRRRRVLELVAAVGLAFLFAGPAQATPARITEEKRIGPRTIELTIATPAFSGPTKVHVNLPTGYDAQPARRWPATYVLAGTMNTYRTFNSFVDGVGLTAGYPSITVSPNGDSGYWSDWYNGGAFGPPQYETYVARQLIPLIDARFRTIPDRSRRAVMGISMGGYGAMMMAARHPDLFGAAASMSGAVDSNLEPNGSVLSLSPTFQGAQADAIYGPRSSQEVRWRGHNPVDLATNLRDVDLQVRTANGVPNPGLGENALSADTVSCAVEAGVYQASVSLHNTFDRLRMPHEWRDYGPGCHTVANFTREIADTLRAFTPVLARPAKPPATIDYASVEPRFDVWGWTVRADPARPVEFMRLRDAGSGGVTLVGSGTTGVATPAWFRGLRRVDLVGAKATSARPDAQGRVRFAVDLGPVSSGQQFRSGVKTNQTTRRVALRPHARVVLTRARATRTRVKACARAIAGPVTARIRVTGARRRALTRSARFTVTAKTRCRTLRMRRPVAGRRATVRISGRDPLRHRVGTTRRVRLPRR